ncbi:cytochrome c biogenesis protein CcsA [Wandonia haliotis]
MEKFLRKLFSMELMTVGLILFLVAIARATFIESAHGTQAAKAVIYNAKWFEVLMIYLSFSLVANIFRYRMYTREKIAIFFFHISFIVIIIGAGLTRYVGFEGIMLIREGERSNTIYSADAYLQIMAHDNQKQYEYNKPLIMADFADNYFLHDFEFPGIQTPFSIEYLDYIPNAISSIETDLENGKTILEIVTPGEMGMDTNYVSEGTVFQQEGLVLAFEYPQAPATAVHIQKAPTGFTMTAPADVSYMLMSDQSSGVIPADSVTGFYQGRLYTMQGNNFVFRAVHEKSVMKKVKSPVKDMGQDVLKIKLKAGNEEKIIELDGGQGRIPVPTFFQFGGLNFKLAYGAYPVKTPFYLALRDFQLERYPGSDSPSSYASEITVIDEELNKEFDRRIFMNSVMDYRGYRFFQSSYDPDELGTRLSVNQDFWGTNVTYFGYLLMTIGMIMTLFAPASRFRELNRKIAGIHRKKAGMTVLALVLSFGAFSQTHDTLHDGHNHEHHDHDHDHSGHDHQHAHDSSDTLPSSETSIAPHEEMSEEDLLKWKKFDETPISAEHAKKLESLIIQDYEGRFKPFQTVALEILRKIHRSDTYNGLTATQVFMDMHLNPEYWMKQPIIAVSNEAIREKLALSDKYAAFKDFFDPITGEYLLEEEVEKSNRKPATKQSDYDKQIIKVNERLQILNITVMYKYLRILPVKNDPNHTWYHPMDKSAPYSDEDSLMPRAVMTYFSQLAIGKTEGDYSGADEWLGHIKTYQQKIGENVIPSEMKINMEISYNKLDLFKKLSYAYLILGFLLLVLFFVSIFTNSDKWIRIPNVTLTTLVIVAFVLHAVGLGMRWYISGHAPWSDGYEALVFIAWVTVLAGLVFSRKSKVTLGGTALLTFFILFVSHMNQLDPAITNLVPVLQSYWLMIHVAIITGSYGFLGLGAILAIINLTLYLLRSKNNRKEINLHINEISYVVELTITVGLFMLTIGTFLGGIWANESWGRYWGWDPKETWALVSILVYAVLLHLRYIPALQSKLVFNSVAMWSFGAILFTFFGVNFFLVGLHSYAEGEADTMWPDWVIGTIIGFAIFNLLAIVRAISTQKKKR